MDEAARSSSGAIRRLAHSYYPSTLLLAAVELGIPDLVAGGPVTAAEIAKDAGADASALHRLMRGLAVIGVLDALDAQRFAATEMSERLRSDVPASEAGPVRILAGDFLKAWLHLADSVRTGGPAAVFGMSFYDHVSDSPQASRDFSAVMRGDVSATRSILAETYDFASSSIVDVGGGAANVLIAILRHYPLATGTVFDQPETAKLAQARIESEGFSDRAGAVSGDFFVSVPAGADIYLLRSIINDWSDQRARRILEVCRAAMTDRSRLLLVNRVMPEEFDPSAATASLIISDLESLVVKGGHERSEREYRALLGSAGLKLTQVVPMLRGRSVLEARSADA
jgi:hypothetical protein